MGRLQLKNKTKNKNRNDIWSCFKTLIWIRKLLHGQFLNFLFVYLFISFLYWVYGHAYLQIFDTIFDCNATFELYVNDVIQCIPMSDSKLFVKIFILIMHSILVNNMMMRDITQVNYLYGLIKKKKKKLIFMGFTHLILRSHY